MHKVLVASLCAFSVPFCTTFAGNDLDDFLNAEVFEEARDFVKEAKNSFLRSRGKEVQEPTAFSRLWGEVKESVKTVVTEVSSDYRQVGSGFRQYVQKNPEVAGLVGITSFYVGLCLGDLWEWSRVTFCSVAGVTGVVLAALIYKHPAQMKALGKEYFALVCIACGSAVSGLCVKNMWNSLKGFVVP